MISGIVSGLLLGLAFPLRFGDVEMPNCGWLAWVALVPLFLQLRNATPYRAFRATFVAAFCWYGISLYWVYTALNTYGRLSAPLSFCLLLLMLAIMAAYIALAPWCARWIAVRWEREPLWLLPAAWVAIELARNYGPCGGFPWSNLAETQYAYLPLIQCVDVTGISGLTFLLVWVNRWLAHVIGQVREGKWNWREGPTWVTAGLLLGTLIYGTLRYTAVRERVGHWPMYQVALLQGNIPQEEKWRPGLEEDQLASYRHLLTELRSTNTFDLVIWPEASYPWPIPTAAAGVKHGFFTATPWPMLIGGLAEEGSGSGRRLYNSAFVVNRDGAFAQERYDKNHLVPFGEYVPYQRIFRFARRLAAPIGNYVAGETIAPLAVGEVRVGALICYEDTFPEIARAHALRGAHFLANLTNDAWYGRSAAAKQHFALSVFRAVETRRSLVRATNTGVSGIIDPTGRIIAMSPLFEAGVITGPIRLGNGRTPYVRFGDWVAYACILLVAAAAMLARRQWVTGSHP